MIGFAALRWDVGDSQAVTRVGRVVAALRAADWRHAIDLPGWALMHDPRTPSDMIRPYVTTDRVVVGPLFDRQATAHSRSAAGRLLVKGHAFGALCRHLRDACWGGYVALGIEPNAPHTLSLFRDPIGTLDCLTWAASGIRIATSRPDLLLPMAPPDDLGIDWPRVGQLLRFPGSGGEAVPLLGLTVVPPGTLLRASSDGIWSERLWSFAGAAHRRFDWPRTPAESLPDLIDACVTAWAGGVDRAIAELSGGLDSAIVAAALGRCQPQPVARWFHYYGPDAPGDERIPARAVARQLGLPCDEVCGIERPIDAVLVDAIPVGARPSLASLSLFHDQDLAHRGQALGATHLFTGHGGDAVFYQYATPLIACDLRASPLPLATRLAAIPSLARWTGRSTWSIAAHALMPRRRRLSFEPDFPLDLVSQAIPHQGAFADERAAAADLAPAKQLQILNLAATRARFAPSWTSETMTLVHPLLSQPLVERMASLSAFDLTCATRDRALIRSAYARRLPPEVIARRGKGSVTAYYGRMLARSLPFLRDYLLGGALARHQILDLTALETCLTIERLMESNIYAEIYSILFMERWVRHWLAVIAETKRQARTDWSWQSAAE
ncbi:hypothetical protein HL653_22170 [Sphingomonas sp. AP4-R1]|uniref:asparagine synthase-related protein n=1 Tax=Sphingomonas sp. AP4-R1 TaxID=2735134 RepID=UPI0014934A27|nr:asparagine synthetase B family protein [Sphingomonas sp. AP4-R1]QJU60081.1 hypothetical protein HL653_22170 [Sphingomonas sp. AP4-R1]